MCVRSYELKKAEEGAKKKIGGEGEAGRGFLQVLDYHIAAPRIVERFFGSFLQC